ncbi:MAG: phasin family protein [Rhodocyclaceae bacterium]|nr:phasin family protein [Rhodocyclaceae bacterium]
MAQGKAEHWKELQRKNLEAALQLAQATMSNSLTMIGIQNQLAQELLRLNLEHAQALASAQSPDEVIRLRNEQAQAVAQKILAATQKIAELGNAARSEFARLMTEQLAAGSQEMADAIQGFWQNFPAEGQPVVEAMQQAMAAANRTFEQMTQAAVAAFRANTDSASKRK